MKIDGIQSNQSFNGNFILVGKFSGKQIKEIESLIQKFGTEIKRQPYDIFIKQTNSQHLALSLNKDFTPKVISDICLDWDGNKTHDCETAYRKLRCRADSELLRQPFHKAILYELGLKKYKGNNFKSNI